METGLALEIVHAMAKKLHLYYGEIVPPARNIQDVVAALNTVEDLIVNNFGEE